MRYRPILLSLVALAATSALSAQSAADAPTPPKARLKALVIDGQNNHNWRATSPVIKAGLEETGRYKVNVSTSPQ